MTGVTLDSLDLTANAERVRRLNRDIGKLIASRAARDVLEGLGGRISEALALAYLDGLGDTEREDAEQSLDGLTRAQRASAHGERANEIVGPYFDAFATVAHQLHATVLAERAAINAPHEQPTRRHDP